MENEFWDGLRAPGIPDSIDTSSYKNLLEILTSAFDCHGKRPAFTGMGHTLTYSEIDELSSEFCRYLQYHTDLQVGDRIAIQMANLLQYPVVLYCALKAGLIIVNTNPLYTAREMQHQFNDAGVKALVFMSTFGDKVAEVLPHTSIETVIVTNIGDLLPFVKRTTYNFLAHHIKKMVPRFSIRGIKSFRNALAMGRRSPQQKPVDTKPNDIAALQYTGGTTGVAKGAILTHANLVANMLQINAGLQQTDSSGERIFKPGEEVIVAPLPFYHIYAFTMHLISAAHNGQHNILIANPRDPDLFVRALKPWKITVFVGLNTLFISLLRHAGFRNLDFGSLKATNSGGAALATDTNERWAELTGCRIAEGYGLTECSPVVCASGAGDHVNPQSVGLPLPNTALKLIDARGAEIVTPGKAGELCIKGPQVMKGYWNQPEATKEVLDEEGWFKSGDIATIDEDGVVRIVDRVKDLVIVSGFNVYPNEIESVVTAHPSVEHAAAIGVEDEKTGEAVKLFVVRSDPELTQSQLLAYCREQLTAYKVPKIIEFRTELPMTPVGKVLRKELRAEVSHNSTGP
ncbi:AMP-binding protein [Parahaliea mediterranea]|uniref:Long-chain-fatty-acid--CoA ligase n=2 Tax=Parahaliea mediterranea TaxID=651086 RepID=A0A939DF91_9GAMM|nr:AMP-binding protein [Parahaliea mediterranea]